MPENNGDCAPIPDRGVDRCVCSIAIGPNKFDEAEIKKKGESIKNFCFGAYFNRNSNACSLAKRDYMKKNAGERLTAIKSYWNKQVGETVKNWVKTANELESLKEKMKRY